MISSHCRFIATFLFLLMVLSFCMHSLGMHWHHKVLPVTACHCQEREPGAPHTILAMPSHKPSCYLSPNLFSWNKPWMHLLWGSAHHPLESSSDSRMRLCLSEEKKSSIPTEEEDISTKRGMVLHVQHWASGHLEIVRGRLILSSCLPCIALGPDNTCQMQNFCLYSTFTKSELFIFRTDNPS